MEGTPEYRRIFERGELLSKIAARTGDLAASLALEKRFGYWHGILARLHQPGTVYSDSEFVFSVAKFPEPQILPAAAALNGMNRVYLLKFEMPAFDLLGATIADVARRFGPEPHLFRYDGVLFNGSDPDVEIFVLHKTEISGLTWQVFDSRRQVKEFSEPYRQRMERGYARA